MSDINEWLMILILMISAGLWAAGGTRVNDKIDGQKWLRRILLPVILSLLAYTMFHVELWRCIAFALASMVVFSLGYGDKNPWWAFKWDFIDHKPLLPKWLIAALIYAPTAFLGLSWWLVISPAVFLLTFAASQWEPLKKEFVWITVEFLHGFMLGTAMIGAIN